MWRLAHSLEVLRAELNAKFPKRSKASDGTIGDAAHAARTSDHNPNDAGVVRAFDATAYADVPVGDNIDGDWLFNHSIDLGKQGHLALQNHGYVIWDRHAAYASNGWEVVPYKGLSPHREHVHISVGRGPVQYDSVQPWGINTSAVDPPKKPAHDWLEKGDNGANVLFFQAMCNIVLTVAKVGDRKPLKEDGAYGDRTAARCKELEHWMNAQDRKYKTGNKPLLEDGKATKDTCSRLGWWAQKALKA